MRIRIFGGVASGKSTLADFLGSSLGLPVFSTDTFVFLDDYQTRRSPNDRKALISKSLKSYWIVEGVHFASWCEDTYKFADVIIVLKRSKFLLLNRILKRTFAQEKGSFFFKLSSAFKLSYLMLRDTNKEIKQYIALANKFSKKLIIVTSDDYSSVLKNL